MPFLFALQSGMESISCHYERETPFLLGMVVSRDYQFIKKGDIMRKLSVICLITFSLMSWVIQSVLAIEYTYTPIDFPEARQTYTMDINNMGQAVGFYHEANYGYIHGFLFDGSSFTTINFPDASETIVNGINDKGLIIGGYSSDSDGGGFLFNGRKFRKLELISSVPGTSGINNSKQIVGTYYGNINNDGDTWHGLLLDKNGFFTIDVPGSNWTFASGINDNGMVVGYYSDSIRSYGFLLIGDTFSTIDLPGSTYFNANGINNINQIVGLYSYGGGVHGFLLDDSNFSTIDFPGALHTHAYGINDAAQVVGLYYDVNNKAHGFIADPVACQCPTDNVLPSGCIFGSVRDADTREKLAGETVILKRIFPKEPKLRKKVVTTNNGCYRFVNLEPGTYKVILKDCEGRSRKIAIIDEGSKVKKNFLCIQ